jgi:hypothetical protein
MDVPIVIIAYNNYTYVKNMIEQLISKKISKIHIIDNNSTYPKLLEYYQNNQTILFTLHTMNHNYGHRVLFKNENTELYDSLPNYFILTDPDIQLNPKIPTNFINQMIELSEKYRIGKVGVALDISDHNKFRDITFTRFNKKKTIHQWEQQFWHTKLDENIYLASIDTTFALHNKKYFQIANKESIILKGLRIAGDFTSKHLPWYKDNIVPDDEIVYYNKHSNCSFWGY